MLEYGSVAINMEDFNLDIKDFHVEMWLNKYENDCKYNLSDTFPHRLTAGELLKLTGKQEELTEELLNLGLDYGEITGSLRLRTAISGLYRNVSPDRISVAHGAIGANAQLLLSLVSPGDHVISVIPSYQQLYSLPESLGADITLLRLREETGWSLDTDELKNAVTDRTRLICLNNPNNPTGSVLTESQMKEIAEIADARGIYVLCDEAYRGLCHEGDFFRPSFTDIYDKAVVTGGMSKTFALAGLRIGWIAGPAKIIDDINRHRDYHIISAGKIDDLLACIAIENKDAILKRNIAICRQNLDYIDSWIRSEPEFSFVRPAAATTCFVKYDLPMASEELCHRLRREAGVLFVPGSAFEHDRHFRFGYGNHPDIIREGLEAVSFWLEKYRSEK